MVKNVIIERDIHDHRRICDLLMSCLIVALLFCITMLEMSSWGRYLFLVISLAAYGVCLFEGKGKLRLLFHKEQLYSLLFVIFTFLSSAWAINRTDSLSKGVTLLEIFLSFYCFYLYYHDSNNPSLLLRAIKISGFLISVYTLFVYGMDELLYAASTSATRLHNEFANINGISIVIAVAILIQVWDLQHKRDKLMSFFFLPAFVVIFAFQTRKVFVFLLIGVLGLLVFNNILKKDKQKGFIGLIIGLLIFAVLFCVVYRLPAFRGAFERMDQLFGWGNSTMDHSALVRNQLVKAGFESWKRNPLLGIGIGCSHYIAIDSVGVDYYLHNNYVELLSGGGLIGFVLYYWYFLYLLQKVYFYRKNSIELFSLTFVWILLLLIMDYGMVSYYSKTQWFYLLTISVIQRNYFNRREK